MGNRASIIYGRTDGADAGVNLPVKVEAYGDGTGVLVTSVLPYADSTASAAAGSVSAAAAATDVVVIGTYEDNPGTNIRRIIVSAVATAAGATTVLLIGRTSPVSGGTSTQVTDTLFSTFAAGVNFIDLYTANPTVGSGTNVLARRHLQYSSAALGVAPVPLVFDFSHAPIPISFSDARQVALNLNGATVAGLTLNVTVEFERTA